MNKDKGYVYILTNPSFREDWVKIGKSQRAVDVRTKELDNTAVPLPFEIYATLKTSKYNEVEQQIHRQIDLLTDLRIRKNREFFNVKPQVVLEILKDISKLLDDAELEELYLNDNNIVKKQENSIPLSKIDKEQFLATLDTNGEKAFTSLYNFAKEKSLLFRWGTKNFSLNLPLNNGIMGLCYGYTHNSVYKQSIFVGFEQIKKKIPNSEEIISFYKNQLSKMSCFVKTNKYYKWIIDNSYNENDMKIFVKLLGDILNEIEKIFNNVN
ncbi:MAG: GIY-YIG nuclease family protein [Marinilabiliaceae bacterium]|nr:GIY-YIG nuclease family protein [Marinilabiliaceae bacterium]